MSLDSISLIALDIRSSENVGSFFRTADGLGIEKIYLVGITPAPNDKFNKINSKIAKTALGAEKSVPYEYFKTLAPLLTKLKKSDYKIVALEQASNSIDYRNLSKVLPCTKIALIVGNEVTGIPPHVLKKCDTIIEIPMRGKDKGGKESYNVAVALAITLAELTRMW